MVLLSLAPDEDEEGVVGGWRDEVRNTWNALRPNAPTDLTSEIEEVWRDEMQSERQFWQMTKDLDADVEVSDLLVSLSIPTSRKRSLNCKFDNLDVDQTANLGQLPSTSSPELAKWSAWPMFPVDTIEQIELNHRKSPLFHSSPILNFALEMPVLVASRTHTSFKTTRPFPIPTIRALHRSLKILELCDPVPWWKSVESRIGDEPFFVTVDVLQLFNDPDPGVWIWNVSVFISLEFHYVSLKPGFCII